MRVEKSAPKTPPAPVWPASLWIALALALVTLAVYCPVTDFQFVNWDDTDYVTDNPHVQAGLTADGFKWAWKSEVSGEWQPITMLSHMLDCQLFGVKPWWPHLVNALLHAANTVLLFGLFKRMTGALWRSAAVAALFALHPLHVESVAWVCERKDVLSTLFWFLTTWAYVRYANKVGDRRSEVGGQRSEVRGQWSVVGIYYGLSLLFFALGLMSKPMLVTLPCALLLLDYWPLARMKPGASLWGLVVEKLPFFAMSAAVSVVTIHAEKQGGGMLSLQYYPFLSRLGNALVSYVRYIEMMFWPRHLAALYLVRSNPWPWWVVALAALFLLAVSALVLGQGRRRPYLAVGWFWYLGTLVPVIGLTQAGMQALADRFTYVPLIGLFVMLAWGGWELAAIWRMARFAPAAMAAALAACAACAAHQEFYWKDSESLNQRMIDTMPDNGFAHNNLGAYYLDTCRTNDALTHFIAAVQFVPSYAPARNNLGMALDGEGQTDEAIRQYQQAILLNSNYAAAHYNLGVALGEKRQINEAISQYQEAIRLKPDLAQARNNLGMALEKKGRLDDAIGQFQEAIRINPNAFSAHNNLGAALARKGQLDGAISQFQEAVRLNPDYAQAHNNLGSALAGKGQLDGAIRQFQEALRLRPDLPEARNNLARALAIKQAKP